MRAIGVMQYHWRRRWPLMLSYVLVLTAITMTILLVAVPKARQFVMGIDAQGYVQEQVSFDAITLSQNPNAASDFASYSFLVMVLAFLTIGKSRKYLVSLSITRYEILLGSFLFLAGSAVALSLIGNFIVPMLTRVALLIMGVPVRGGWGPLMVLTGNDPNFWPNLASSICSMLFMGTAWVFVGYVMMRWWKPILILFAAGIVGLIFLARMVQWSTYVKDLAEHVIDFVRWVADWLIPAVQNYWNESNSYMWSLRYLAGSVALTLITYPIMRGRKVT